MIYPEIAEIEARREKLYPLISKERLCDRAGMSDDTYRLWLKGKASPSLQLVHLLRAALDHFESDQRKNPVARPPEKPKKRKKSKHK